MNFINTIIILVILIIVINYLTNGNIKIYIKKYFYKCLDMSYKYFQDNKSEELVLDENNKSKKISKQESIPLKKKNIKSKDKSESESSDIPPQKTHQNIEEIFIKSETMKNKSLLNENFNESNHTEDSLIPSVELTEYETSNIAN